MSVCTSEHVRRGVQKDPCSRRTAGAKQDRQLVSSAGAQIGLAGLRVVLRDYSRQL